MIPKHLSNEKLAWSLPVGWVGRGHNNGGQLSMIELLLMKYGLVAVFACAALEADVVPVLTGVAVHMGYFRLMPAIGSATVGAFAGDCVWFLIGRNRSQSIRAHRRYRRAGNAAEALAQRFGVWHIPLSHVVYGTRIATMTFAGIRRLSFMKFAIVDLVGCVTLTTALVTLGFGFSRSAALIIGHLKKLELTLLLGVMALALLCYLWKVISQPKLQDRPD
jgi:membrane protein DedA with SNARE-associated domain